MEDLKSKLHWCNGMILLSDTETEFEGDEQSKDDNKKLPLINLFSAAV